MGQNYFKKTCIVVIVLFTSVSCISQSLVVYPYYGRKWFNSNSKNIINNNFDPNFQNNVNSSRYIIGLSLGYLKKDYGLEMYFSSQPTLYKIKSFYTPVGVEFEKHGEGSFSQFQFLFNRKFISKNNNTFKVIPIFSSGLGLGIVNSQSLLDNNKFNERINGQNNEFIDLDFSSTKKSSISYSGIIKIGIAINKQNREWVRLQAICNLGFNKIIENEFVYTYTNKNYSGTIFTKGSYYGFQISSPIYLKRSF